MKQESSRLFSEINNVFNSSELTFDKKFIQIANIVKKIAEANGGYVKVFANQPNGSVFKVSI